MDERQPQRPLVEASRVFERLSEFPLRAFEAGDVVLHEGNATNRLLVLQNGTVDVVKDDVLLARVSQQGAVFGDMAVILGQAHTADVLASTPSSFFVIEDARRVLESDADLGRYLLVELAKRLDDINRLLIDARAALIEAESRHGHLHEVILRIGRALNLGARS
jgi:signal-transduction protein with cAMP-binding, CBS, and nucleotidyltransferase domain